tara:strand:+ start:210 stop:431 length:222 start_codon:yes stop_codon:yes gene_type:complete
MKYMIIPYSDVTDDMILESQETSRDTLRHTVSGDDKVILKYSGSDPIVFDSYTKYTHSQIKSEIVKEEWIGEE